MWWVRPLCFRGVQFKYWGAEWPSKTVYGLPNWPVNIVVGGVMASACALSWHVTFLLSQQVVAITSLVKAIFVLEWSGETRVLVVMRQLQSTSSETPAPESKKRKVAYTTFQKWKADLDHKWLWHWTEWKKIVTNLRCVVCTEFIASRRNFSEKWLLGADSVRTSNIRDHAKADQHMHSVHLRTVSDRIEHENHTSSTANTRA